MSKLIAVTTIGLVTACKLIFLITLFFTENENPFVDFVTDSVDEFKETLSYLLDNVYLTLFIGFGLLMTHLKKYRLNSLSFTILLSSFVIIWYLIVEVLFYVMVEDIFISTTSLIRADLAAIAFLISCGAVVGKFNILQLFLMAFLETPIYIANKYLTEKVFMVADAGGSTWLHMFGAFFGLGVSLIQGLRGGRREYKTDLELSSYENDISAMIGTLFLWVVWPSFNAISAENYQKLRALLNTYICLIAAASYVIVGALSNSRKDGEYKISMIYIEQVTLSAGVCIGCIANVTDLPVFPYVCGWAMSLFLGPCYLPFQTFLAKKLRIHDTRGVFTFHAFPGMFGSLVGLFLFSWETPRSLESEYSMYPEIAEILKVRPADNQVVSQMVSILSCMWFGFAGGLLTGCFIALFLPKRSESELYQDEHHWEVDDNK